MTKSDRHRAAGFTLIEALAALAIVSVALAAIGSLAAANIRGTARLERQLALIEASRTVLNTFAARRSELTNAQVGRVDGFGWRAQFRPTPQQPNSTSWAPQTATLTVQAPNGTALQIETVRLRQIAARAR